MNDVHRIALAARVFALAVVVSTAAVAGAGLRGAAAVVTVAVVIELATFAVRLPEHAGAVIEGAVVAVVAMVAYPEHPAVLPYLATPALVAGVAAGIRWAAATVVVESIALGIGMALFVATVDSTLLGSVVTWIATAAGVGLLGVFTRRRIAQSSTDSGYREALDLIRQFQTVSGRLSAGLDPRDLADDALAQVGRALVVRRSAVVVRDGSAFRPIRFDDGSLEFSLDSCENVIRRAWDSGQPVLGDSEVALPLVADGRPVAVLVATPAGEVDLRTLQALTEDLQGSAVRLHAALLFATVRETATVEERNRVAREVHDGVAQDVASFGYALDAIAADADEATTSRIHGLREDVTRIVGELRNSVFELRNDVAPNQGLGQSISGFARHIGAHSSLTVHVTLDEAPVRLGTRVEAELLRITQEAINNARRHSGGENLWVTCRVRPPGAQITVVDDGDGLGDPRTDSHGLRIMRERADRIGADLAVESPSGDGRGTTVRVSLD